MKREGERRRRTSAAPVLLDAMPESGAAGLDLAVSRSSMAEQVVFKLLAHIRSGNLKAGDRLPTERDLAETIGVSRPTLREALRALIILGAIRSRQGEGMFVSELKAEELLGPLQFFLTLEGCSIDDLYDARALIEGGLARRAAQRADAADVAELARLLELQGTAVRNPPEYRRHDVAFHKRISDVAGNAFLARIAAALNVIGMEFRETASETPSVIRQSLADHERVIQAMRKHDGAAADDAMQEHMRHVLKSTRKSVQRRGRLGEE
jgi:DNA-binding FadR family transcriptional regulator